MRPPESPKRRLVAQWVHRADEDVGVVEALVERGGLYPNAIVFHCQQAVEKYLKGFLVSHEVEFPKTHDLAQILALAKNVDANLAEALCDATLLTPYGVEFRYPSDRPDATPAHVQRAMALAVKVRDAVMRALVMD